MSKSKLAEIIRDDVEEKRTKLFNEVVEPWSFFNIKDVKIHLANGKPVTYPTGLEFSGTPKQFFWNGFIDDHLKKASRELIESTRKKALERHISVEDALADCHMHIENMIQMAFRKMAKIEQSLLGKGFPDTIPLRDVSDRIKKSSKQISKLVDAEIRCSAIESSDDSEPPPLVKHLGWIFRKKTWESHPILAVIALVVVIAPLVFGTISFISKQKANQRVDPTVKTPVESGNEQGTAGHP